MAEDRDRRDWDHTSVIVATLLNVNRGKGQAAIDPAECHPYRRTRPKARFTVDVKSLKHLFEKKGGDA